MFLSSFCLSQWKDALRFFYWPLLETNQSKGHSESPILSLPQTGRCTTSELKLLLFDLQSILVALMSTLTCCTACRWQEHAPLCLNLHP